MREPEYILCAKDNLSKKKAEKAKRAREDELEKAVKDSYETTDHPSKEVGQGVEVGQTKGERSNGDWVTIDVDDDLEPSEGDRNVLEIVRLNISVQEVVDDVLHPTNLLNDTSSDLFRIIVHENTDFYFNPTSYFAYYTFIKPRRLDKDMHIIGGNATRHWCCVYYDGSMVAIYDSRCRSE